MEATTTDTRMGGVDSWGSILYHCKGEGEEREGEARGGGRNLNLINVEYIRK